LNAGIVAAHEQGIVTSASLMVRGLAAREAAEYAAVHRELSLGLHIDLGEWEWLDEWIETYSVVPVDDDAAVKAEVRRQLETFRVLAQRDPTHIDSHQHVHRGEPVRSAVIEIGEELGVPVRDFSPRVRYCGGFYGQARHGRPFPEGISRAGLLHLLEELPPCLTELSCHPGFDDDLPTMYCRERRREVETLCDAEIVAAIGRLNIQLISFANPLLSVKQ
jgi:predicted glycoside hydrolase/deacetylase ChbG (UPF0249 family)